MTPYVHPLERFFRHVRVTAGCWEWTAKKNEGGYGHFMMKGRTKVAHRWLWEQLNCDIPRPYQCDHLCRNTSCVNPDHIEIVTPRENTLRGRSFPALNAVKTHCIRGHPLAAPNLWIEPKNGKRRCLTCKRARNRAFMRTYAGPRLQAQPPKS